MLKKAVQQGRSRRKYRRRSLWATLRMLSRGGVVALWSSQPTLKAIATHTIFAVASDIFVVPGPRMLDAAQAFAAMLGQTPDQTP